MNSSQNTETVDDHSNKIDTCDNFLNNKGNNEYKYEHDLNCQKDDVSIYKLEDEDDDGEIDIIEQQTYNGVFYADAMDMEQQMVIDAKKYKNKIKQDLKFEQFCGGDVVYGRNFYKYQPFIGDGKMTYITDENERNMLRNAWVAITLTDNWEFMTKDINNFMFSEEPKITEISNKMEEIGYTNHSGSSFGYTMRLMQYLVKRGEEEFMKTYSNGTHKSIDEIEHKEFFEYSGGF